MRTAILAVACVSAAALACSDAPPTSQDLYGTGLIPADSIESIEITPVGSSIRVGASAQLNAIAKDVTGAPIQGVHLDWSSSNTSIATVTDSGVVRGVGAGTATIKAREPRKGKNAVAPIVVTASPLMTISVALSKSTIAIGQTSTATASLRDSSGATVTNKPVAWSTSNSTVASVNGAGLVIALAPGTSSISAAADGLTGSQAVTVVLAPVATVVVSPVSASLITGGTFQLSATTFDADNQLLSGRTVTWSSSNTSVASVSSSGLVTAAGTGSATVTATSEGKTATSAITVSAPPAVPVASVSVALAASSLTVGQTTQATATTRDAAGTVLTGRGITWSSSNTAVARVNSTGVVLAVGVGSATIQATSEGVSGSASLTVSAVPVATVSVSLASSSLTAGQTTQATATLKDAAGNTLTGRSIAWSSSNTSIATVNANGQVTTVAAGSANIVATSEGKTGSASLTVTAAAPAPVATVTVALGSANLNSGQTTQATATLQDAAGNALTGRTITWGSSNTGVATVDANGLVTAVGGGSASITATSEGQAGAATLSVTAVPVATVSVSLASANLTVSQTTQATAILKDAAGNTLTGRPKTWASASPSVATVSANGLVTAIAAGTANIVATSEGKSGQATVTVSAPAAAPVATVTLSPASSNLTVNGTTQLTATLKDAAGNTLTGRTISWASSSSGIAGVSGSGLVTAVALGSATITATSEGKNGTATISVVDVVAPGPGVPVYDPSNPNHVLHVFED
jgi:trimeric autotransporter adhesin